MLKHTVNNAEQLFKKVNTSIDEMVWFPVIMSNSRHFSGIPIPIRRSSTADVTSDGSTSWYSIVVPLSFIAKKLLLYPVRRYVDAFNYMVCDENMNIIYNYILLSLLLFL